MMTLQRPRETFAASAVDPEGLWYASDRRIRTKNAAEHATVIADWLQGGQPAIVDPNEQELFVALHTCAFRAAQPSRGRRITSSQRMAWARRWELIRARIVEKNLGLVYSMIGRFGSRYLDEDDRLSEAMYALTRAVDRFNPWRGYKFSTYACNVIARALMRRGKQESRRRKLFPVQHEMSYERPDALPDGDTSLYVERLHRILDGNLGELTDLESTILSRRFLDKQGQRLTFQEIGAAIGLSKERVRQIQNIALRKLREELCEDPVLQ